LYFKNSVLAIAAKLQGRTIQPSTLERPGPVPRLLGAAPGRPCGLACMPETTERSSWHLQWQGLGVRLWDTGRDRLRPWML